MCNAVIGCLSLRSETALNPSEFYGASPPPPCFRSCLVFVLYQLRQPCPCLCKSCRGRSDREAIHNVAATHQKVVAVRFTPCATRNSDCSASAASDMHRSGRSEKCGAGLRDAGAGSTNSFEPAYQPFSVLLCFLRPLFDLSVTLFYCSTLCLSARAPSSSLLFCSSSPHFEQQQLRAVLT